MEKLVLISTLALVLLSTSLSAQPIPGGRPDDGGAGTHEDTQMPLTTATILLIVLGSGYAVASQSRKNKKK